jgi:hypothetical protein
MHDLHDLIRQGAIDLNLFSDIGVHLYSYEISFFPSDRVLGLCSLPKCSDSTFELEISLALLAFLVWGYHFTAFTRRLQCIKGTILSFMLRASLCCLFLISIVFVTVTGQDIWVTAIV